MLQYAWARNGRPRQGTPAATLIHGVGAYHSHLPKAGKRPPGAKLPRPPPIKIHSAFHITVPTPPPHVTLVGVVSVETSHSVLSHGEKANSIALNRAHYTTSPHLLQAPLFRTSGPDHRQTVASRHSRARSPQPGSLTAQRGRPALHYVAGPAFGSGAWPTRLTFPRAIRLRCGECDNLFGAG